MKGFIQLNTPYGDEYVVSVKSVTHISRVLDEEDKPSYLVYLEKTRYPVFITEEEYERLKVLLLTE